MTDNTQQVKHHDESIGWIIILSLLGFCLLSGFILLGIF